MLLLVAGALSVAAVTALAQSVTVPQTSAPLPRGSQFQGGDGDQANDTAAGLIDWQGLQAGGRVERIEDPQANDDIFTSSKELVPNEWELTTQNGGATPGSGNILDTYRAFEHLEDGDAFLYLGFTRFAAGGTIYVTFELNQAARTTWTNGAGFEIPCRTTGDILITFGTAGSTSYVQIARWVTDTEDATTHCAKDGRLEIASLTPNVDVQGSSNTAQAAIPNYLPGFYGASIPQYRFGEAAINLTRVLGDLGHECQVFGSTWMHSRASLSETADMKDFVAPESFRVRTCKATPSLASSASGIVSRRAHGRHPLRRHRVLSRSLKIHDTATLSDGDHPSGTLTFRLYGPGDDTCANPPVFTDEKTVDGNGSYRSGSFEPTRPGTYRWVVEYSGDHFNEAAGPTPCGKDAETITIAKASPTLRSKASGPTHLQRVRVGRQRFRTVRLHTARATQDISDAAVLEGGLAPTGTITFNLYGPGDLTCSGTPVSTSTVAVDGNGTYYSDPFTPTRTGTYRWVVSYSGDPFNAAAGPTECGDPDETIVVSPAEPTIATVASQATEVNHPISDSATLTGGADPRGVIVFRLYGPHDADCSGPAIHVSRVRVRGNATYTSSEFTPSEVGIYRWIAIYSGDRDNARAATSCNDAGEDVRVRPPPPVQPALTTTASPAAAAAGSLIRDTAHLSGGADPTGSIAFALFGPDSATCQGPPAFVSSATVSGNGDYTSRAFRVREVGTYRWVAVYSGDDGNKPAGPTACADPAETVTVTQAQPRIRTLAQRFGLVGHTVRDAAFLSGASRPTGTITFRLYGPGDPTCSGAPVYEVEQNVVGRNGFYPSPRFRALAAGTYLWTATYSGDANNLPVATPCGDSNETTVVRPRRPRLTTSASPPAFLLRGRRVRAAGQEIYDSARLTGTFRGTGEITFDLYGPDDPTCSGPPIFSRATAVNGDGIYSSARFAPTESGTHRWRATYSGDANNRRTGPTGCDDPNEQVRVTIPADPELTTSASQAVTLGGAIHDTAHLSGGADPTGTITFRLYGPGDADCSGRAVFTSTVLVAGNDDYVSAPFLPATAGVYRWVATYSGDPRNSKAGPTACGDPAEKVVVRPPAITPVVPTFSTTAAQLAAGGSTLYDRAFLSGAIDPVGAITFELFGPDDATCARPPAFVTTLPVMGNGEYRSASFTVPTFGTYRWVVTYSGDAMNTGVGPTACGESTETVSVSGGAVLPDEGANVPTPRPRPRPKPRPSAPRPVTG